jgi:hypothetical protein
VLLLLSVVHSDRRSSLHYIIFELNFLPSCVEYLLKHSGSLIVSSKAFFTVKSPLRASFTQAEFKYVFCIWLEHRFHDSWNPSHHKLVILIHLRVFLS